MGYIQTIKTNPLLASSPPDGSLAIIASIDGFFYVKDDAGVVQPLGTGGFYPTRVLAGETFKVPANQQALYAIPPIIEPGGTLQIDGEVRQVRTDFSTFLTAGDGVVLTWDPVLQSWSVAAEPIILPANTILGNFTNATAEPTGLTAEQARTLLDYRTGNTLFVDAENGDDSTGTATGSKPYATCLAAETAASSGDLIIVRPGIYSGASLGTKTGINWYWERGSSYTQSFTSMGAVWAISGTVRVRGHGRFVTTLGSGLLITSNAADCLFEADEIVASSAGIQADGKCIAKVSRVNSTEYDAIIVASSHAGSVLVIEVDECQASSDAVAIENDVATTTKQIIRIGAITSCGTVVNVESNFSSTVILIGTVGAITDDAILDASSTANTLDLFVFDWPFTVPSNTNAIRFFALDRVRDASAINAGTLDIARIPTGTSSSTVCIGNDGRLSDARTPLPHTHATSEITGLDALLTNFRPVVLTQPTAASGNVGQSLSISCLGGILPNTHLNLTYQWQLSTDAGVSYSNITGATSATIPFAPALFGNNGLYRCRLANAFGTQDTNAVALTIDNAIRHLYGVNDRGVAWDLDRMDHLFQVSTGSSFSGPVPVTSYGDPVGLIFSRERGGLDAAISISTLPTLPTPTITNGSGSNGVWNAGTATLSNTIAGTDSIFPRFTFTIPVVSGRYYRIRGNVSHTHGLSVRLHNTGTVITVTNGDFVIPTVCSTGNTLQFLLPGTSVCSATFTSLIIEEVPGTHLIQATSSRRPAYARRPKSGIRNLLQRTEEFENAYWFKLNTTVESNTLETTDPLGGNTATKLSVTSGSRRVKASVTGCTAGEVFVFSFYGKAGTTPTITFLISNTGESVFTSGAFDVATQTLSGVLSGYVTGRSVSDVGNGWYRFTINCVIPAGQNTIAVNVGYPNASTTSYVWRAQLESGTTATPYQRVTNQFDVTESGQPSINYLWFDGIDDCLQSATAINFTNSDEMTVCVGARKATGLNGGLIAELTNSSGGNNGSFGLFYPLSSSSSNQIQGRSRGTIQADAPVAGFTGEQLRVLTMQSKIAAPYVRVRVDAVQQAENTATQGTGNYANDFLNIGSRNQASTFFQGHLNSGFIINRILNPAILADYERHWVAAKAGIDLP